MHRLTNGLAILALAGLLAGLATGCSRQAREARHTQRADAFFDAGRYPEAEVEYLNVLRMDRANSHAIGRLGIIYYDNGRLARAYSYLTNAGAMEPANPAVRLRVGYVHLLEGRIREARADANAVGDSEPNNEDAPLLLVQTLRTTADVQEARSHFEDLLRQTNGTAALQIGLGTVLLREHDLPGAEAAFKRALELNPKSSAAHAVLGAFHLANNDATNAEIELKIAADLAPPRSPRRVDYADFKWRTGAGEEGKRLLTEMTKSVPDYLPSWIKLARIALEQKRLDDCESLIQQTLSRDPENYDALSLRGAVLLARGETEKAITELERLNNLYLRNPQARFNLALTYYTKGDTGKALQCAGDAAALDPNFDEAVLLQAQLNLRRDHADAAIPILTQLLQRRPQLAQAYVLLAAAYGTKGNLDDALATYRRLAEIYPRDPQASLLIGQVLHKQGKKEEARRAFEESLTLVPGYLPAVEQLVNLDLDAKQNDAALSRLQAELEKSPNSAPLQVLLARVFNSHNDPGRTEQALKKAIELDANFEPAYRLLAEFYANTKRNDQALARLREMVAKNPRDGEALLLMGMVLNDQQDFAAARDAYEKLLAINPNVSAALNNLAYLYSEKFNLLDKAYQAARRAREVKPYDPYSADTLGWILFKRGDYVWALGLLQESAEKLPAEPEIQFHLGMAYYMIGDEARARKFLQLAAAATNTFTGKEEAGRRLELLRIEAQTAGPGALSLLQARLQEQPDDPVALARLTAIFERQGAPEKAADAYEQALKQNPKNARLTIGLARLCSQQLHDSKRAMALAKDAYRLAPDDPDIAQVLGRLAFASGDFKWALSLLEQSARKNAADPELSYDLATAYYSVGRVHDAESAMNGAVRSGEPFARANDAKQFLDLIALAASPARALEAQPRVAEILRTDPANVPALMALGIAAEQRGDAGAAVKAYEQALNRYPEFVPAMRQLAILLADNPGNDPRTYELATKARESLPNDPAIAKALGVLLYRRGDFRGAIRFLNENAQKEAPDGRTMYYLGMAHYQLKESQEAGKALQKALGLNLPAPLADEARRILAGLK